MTHTFSKPGQKFSTSPVRSGRATGEAGFTPDLRLRCVASGAVNTDARFVLYWMTSSRRLQRNFALQRAVEWACQVDKPLVIVETVFVDEPWASARFHRFIIDGMVDNVRRALPTAATYIPFVERWEGEALSFYEDLARDSVLVVTDDFPDIWHRERTDALASISPCRVEAIDSNGLIPLQVFPQAFKTAFSFRLFLQRELPRHLEEFPADHPLLRVGYPPASDALRDSLQCLGSPVSDPALITALDIDQRVGEVAQRGGSSTGLARLEFFADHVLDTYSRDRRFSLGDSTSRLSSYLHFGHVSVHGVVEFLLHRVGWMPERLQDSVTGKRTGWWGVNDDLEAFLEQVTTWRELGFAFSHHRPSDVGKFGSLPDWAQKSLNRHGTDSRPHVYQLDDLVAACTHDPLWNATQRQLMQEGWIQGYLRMLWGKRILEWAPSPREALSWMIELNNRYALDGRDPNSYSGIMWVLGLYDRPWGPRRKIYGTVRYMSTARTHTKMNTAAYISTYGERMTRDVST